LAGAALPGCRPVEEGWAPGSNSAAYRCGNLETESMNLILQIPDDVAQRLSAAGGDLSRRALEALVAEEYRQGHLTKPDLRRLLGIPTSDQIDGFLKAHEIWIDYTVEDLERERADLRRLGF